MSSCAKPERHYGSELLSRGNAMAARAGALLAAEKPRARRGGVAADFLGCDRLWLRRKRSEILFSRNHRADGDVFGDLLHDDDHRRPARGLSPFHAGIAGLA